MLYGAILAKSGTVSYLLVLSFLDQIRFTIKPLEKRFFSVFTDVIDYHHDN